MLIGQVAVVDIYAVADACIFEYQAFDTIQFATMEENGHKDIGEGIRAGTRNPRTDIGYAVVGHVVFLEGGVRMRSNG